MIPKILIKGEKVYKLIKEYTDVVLYQDKNTGCRECFTRYQLGLVKEKVKPEREANNGGTRKSLRGA